MVSWTSARPSGGRPDVPAKMTSSILPPRSDLAPCSPITHASASTTLDLPDPLGPTMQVIPGSSCRVVEEAKDLKPLSVRLLRYNVCSPCGRRRLPCVLDAASSQPFPKWLGVDLVLRRGRVSAPTLPSGTGHFGEACRGTPGGAGSDPLG